MGHLRRIIVEKLGKTLQKYQPGIQINRDKIKNPLLKPNTTPFPNFLIDFVMPIISNPTTKVMMFLVRKIYGWNKDCDHISISQIVKGTNIDRRSVVRALNDLCERKIILKIKSEGKKGSHSANLYSFNEDLPKLPKGKYFHEKRG